MDKTQTAIVTGASSGIGLGLTKALLANGYRVVAMLAEQPLRARSSRPTISPSSTATSRIPRPPPHSPEPRSTASVLWIYS